MKTALGRPLQSVLRLAAEQGQQSWDLPGLLVDAADNLDEAFTFIRSLLNPEENGLAVSASVRNEARRLLGMRTREEPE